MDINQANEKVVNKIMAARPMLTGLGIARDVVPGMKENLIMHAGPPIEWEKMSGPMRGGVIGAILFEKLAKDEKQAIEMVEAGEIEFSPCHHHDSVGPMAGVISSSMMVYIVENETDGNKAYSNLNEGYGKVLRYGAYSPEVLEKLSWMNDVMGPLLAEALSDGEGLDIRALLAEALHMGDEGHNRNKAGSLIFTKLLAPRIAKISKDGSVASEIIQFLGDNALSVLNPVMAACKAMCDAGHGIEGSTVVTTMARNGTEFGIRVSGLGDKWFTAPVEQPNGLYFPGYTSEDASGDIGDSTITETSGIGAFAMAAAPAIVTFISGTPQDALNATLEMYEITTSEHSHFTIPSLDFRGTPTGIDIRKVIELGIPPRVNTGIAHKDAGVGQIGAGLVRPPMAIFEKALIAFAEEYNLG
ncbi:MAG: DUF1116 domain-containing protein [Chloroflexi bacterium]|jgi:hypothetical protein|nr:DUF1116 domain-containing protein [Chloroflexota bacterium]MBT4305618.1 DUF1116 domain-containing protein [Chloroflexota bacterium]MBT4535030.1 DUF1116 domain-containing protein [Chloroflexota bacterium]MBT4683982.1 DUF1116 domain-containing protein [Chloroflexota bacterium]MBT4756490.1 DUF1116 domain-containing protein [Chloroflexota bacterium]